ncbi:MAG: hypothetical protein A2Y73_08700 [Chloroflexi bacterium RBG_13_56_8]|nr:MAG: hypothetical protein A2Y73_08700 [Chloroflexi bacterium RBG_13_56_8]
MEKAGLIVESFQDVRNQQILQALGRFTKEYSPYDAEEFCNKLDTELGAHIELLLRELRSGPPLSLEMAREDFVKCATRLRKTYLSQLIRDLRFVQQDAQEEGDEERVRELNAMIEQLTHDYLRIDRRFHAATLFGRNQKELHAR